MKNKVSIYLVFKKENLLVILFNSLNKKILSQLEIPLLKIVPQLIELIDLKLYENNLNFNSIDSIFFAQKENSWNSNRLVVAFIQALCFGLPINIYKRDLESSEELDFQADCINFWSSFKSIGWKELEPLYNKCPIINT